MYDECRHIKTNGSKCHSPALKGKLYCYHHMRARRLARIFHTPAAPFEQKELDIPFLEDRGAVQIALSEVVMALAGHRIDFKRAGLMIYALQVASANAKTPADLVAVQQVRDAFESEEGEELAPAVTTYEKGDEGYVDPSPREESMSDLLMREIEKQRAREDEHWKSTPPNALEGFDWET